MLKIANVTRVPVEGRKVSAEFFRTRVYVTCNVEFPLNMSRIQVIKALRAVLKANTAELGMEQDTRFFFSKGAGDCGAGWGSGGGFMLDRSIPGEQCTLYIKIVNE